MMANKLQGDSDDPIPIKIGIIGESGLDTPIVLKDRKEYAVYTPFGTPSDVVIEGRIEDVCCCLLSRHGRLHDIMPSNINYRANIWAMRKLGCTHILVTHTVSSLRDYIMPGDMVVPHDLIDHTSRRAQTFYDGAVSSPLGVCNLPMYPAFCEQTRAHLIAAAEELKLPVKSKGTILTFEGPRYSTVAENKMYRSWGADILNMTLSPEAVLAKEAGILYASLCFVTNKECWCTNQPIATTYEILQTFQKNVDNVQKVLISSITRIAKEDWSKDVFDAKIVVCSNFSNRGR